MEQKDSLLESARKRKLSEEPPKLQIISEVADKDQANSIPSNVNCLQDALKEEAKISVENQNVIDSIELNENKIDKVDLEEREVVSDYAKDAMKIEAKKSVEIAIDSIEPTETKRAKVDSHKTMSEKKKTDLVSAFGFDCDNDEKDEYKPSPRTSRVLKI